MGTERGVERGSSEELLATLEGDTTLLAAERIHERLAALDELDLRLGAGDAGEGDAELDSDGRGRAVRLRAVLEEANEGLFAAIRREIASGRTQPLLEMLRWPEAAIRWAALRDGTREGPRPGLGFDAQDEIVSGVLRLREPVESGMPRAEEMVAYQPTPVRHILELIGVCGLTGEDVLIDLGSGLGHVPILVSMLTGTRCVGVERDPEFVRIGRECAESLKLQRVSFVEGDVREADLSGGSVFYLYTPFTGAMLHEVLEALRSESKRRTVRICSLGPCTMEIAGETWLRATRVAEPGRIAVFGAAGDMRAGQCES